MRPDIKARREKYTKVPSKAQELFGGSDNKILNERPFGMDFDLYKQIRSYQTKVLKGLTRGRSVDSIASQMKEAKDSYHLKEQVLKARLQKYANELKEMPKETPKTVTLIDKVLNFFRNINSWSIKKTVEESEA